MLDTVLDHLVPLDNIQRLNNNTVASKSTATGSSYYADLESVYVVIPAYNEGKRIGQTIKEIMAEGFDNIVVVDDGSLDDTFQVAEGFNVCAVQHCVNLGPGAATSTGIESALRLGAKIIVTCDADGQHAADDLRKTILPILENKADVVIGNRCFPSSGMPAIRRVANLVGNLLTYMIAGLAVSDSQSGLKAFSRDAASKIDISALGYEFCSEIIREIKFKKIAWTEIDIQAIYTDYSKAKGQSFSTGLATASKLVIRSLLKAH